MVTPVARREAIAILMDVHEMSERRACKITGADRSSVRDRHRRNFDRCFQHRLSGCTQHRDGAIPGSVDPARILQNL